MSKPKSLRELDSGFLELIKRARKSDIAVETREVNIEDRTVVHYISTKEADSYQSIFLPDCFNEEIRYARNQLVMWYHGLTEYKFPIGTSLWRKPDKYGVLAKTKFARTDFAAELLQLYADDMIRGWSVGGWVLNSVWDGSKEFDELVAKWKLEGLFDVIFTEFELAEYSSVPLPSNAGALATAVRDGKIRSEILVRDIGDSLELKKDRSLAPIIETSDTDDLDEPDDIEALPEEIEDGGLVRVDDYNDDQDKVIKRISDLEGAVLQLKRDSKPAPQKKINISKPEVRAAPVTAVDVQKMVVKTVAKAIRDIQGKLS